MNQTPPQQNTNEKTRAKKEGTSWLKVVLITIGAFILIGVLAVGLAFWIMSSSVENARSGASDARVQTELNQFETGLELYANENDSYPASLSELEPDFLQIVPEHPVEGESYQYTRTNGGGGYCVGACVEGEAPAQTDQQCVQQLQLSCGSGSGYAIAGELPE